MPTPFHKFADFIFRAILICLVAVSFVPAYAEDSEMVLWWQVGDPFDDESLNDVTVKTFHEGDKSAAELGVTHARVRVVDPETYLPVVDVDNAGQTFPSAVVPGEAYSSIISPYASAEYSFIIELGNWENGAWTMIAASDVTSYSSLVEKGYVNVWSDKSIYPQNPAVWAPTYYTVPEPSGGLLLMIGGGLLALRRRRGVA